MEQNTDKQIIQDAILDLFERYNIQYGSVKKFKRKGYLIIEAITGGWSENEEAIEKFNKTPLSYATIEFWFLTEWKRGGYFKWEIALGFL